MQIERESANLDVLRATAIMLVVVMHMSVYFGYENFGPLSIRSIGLLGVLFFFVHTSLVLMFSLERQQARAGSAHGAAVLVAAGLPAVSTVGRRRAVHLLASHTGDGPRGPFPAVGRNGPLGPRREPVPGAKPAPSPIGAGPLWSLPYEMQMYLFLPALFLVATRARRARSLIALWGLAAVLAVATRHPALRGYVPDFFLYVPCFLPGVVAYYLSSRTRAHLPFVMFPMMLTALVAVYFVVGKPGGTGIVFGWLVCLLLGIALPHFLEVRSSRVRRVSHVIATYSYGVYLTHYFALWVAFGMLADRAAWLRWPIFLALCVGVPVLLFHTIEAPMIRVGARLAGRFTKTVQEPKAEPRPVSL